MTQPHTARAISPFWLRSDDEIAKRHRPEGIFMASTTPAPVPTKDLIADIVGHLGAAVLLMPDTVEDAASLHIRQAHALVKQLRRASL